MSRIFLDYGKDPKHFWQYFWHSKSLHLYEHIIPWEKFGINLIKPSGSRIYWWSAFELAFIDTKKLILEFFVYNCVGGEGDIK